MEQKVRILVISDIHFSDAYRKLDNNDFKLYFEAFLLQVGVLTAKHGIDYILINGDLAQFGAKDDYEALWDIMLKPLFDKTMEAAERLGVEGPKLLVIPGNHDVNWEYGEFLKNYLSQLDNRVKITQLKFLKEKRTEFEGLFKDYSSFLKEKLANPPYNSLVDFSADCGYLVYKDYMEKRLFGYVIDRKRNMLFVLLNSAWYSLGGKFNRMYALQTTKSLVHGLIKKEIALPEDLDFKEDHPFVKALLQKLETKEVFNEYGKQVAGINLMENDEEAFALLKTFLKSYPDYTFISCMHHSLNWLNWEESYNYDQVSSGKTNAAQLIRDTDILITGHEHVPENVERDKMAGNVIHVKAGCFLFDKQSPNPHLENSWFSILEIDHMRSLVTETKVTYDVKDHGFKSSIGQDFTIREKQKAFEMSDVRMAHWDKIMSNRSVDVLKRLVDKKKVHCFNPSQIIQFNTEFDEIFFSYRAEEGDKAELFLVARKEKFYGSLCGIDLNAYLQKQLSETNASEKIVRIVVLDKYVDGAPEFYKQHVNEQKELLFETIIQTADNNFNRLRHNFFLQYEENAAYNNSPLGELRNVMFVNAVIPWWNFESIEFN